VGGVWGALQLPPFIGIIEHLGHPAYLMTILGVWYFLAGVALLAPRFPNAGCFRSLLLVICPYLYLAKAVVPDLEPTRIGYGKFGGNILQSNDCS
jgi:hypothetical protein